MEREETVPFGFQNVPVSEKQPMVDAVFSKVARRYDLMNDLMSAGVHRLWKDALVSRLAPPRSGRRTFAVLDVAGGTGDIAFRIAARAGNHVLVTVLDHSPAMLEVGRARAAAQGVRTVDFVAGNAETLPFMNEAFDAYTIAFGIRNVPVIETALAEAYRVLKPGGKFLCLEFSTMDAPFLDKVYEAYSLSVIPAMGRLVANDAESYRYLVESIRRFPHQERFKAMIERAGFRRVTYTNFSFGIVALHQGVKI